MSLTTLAIIGIGVAVLYLYRSGTFDSFLKKATTPTTPTAPVASVKQESAPSSPVTAEQALFGQVKAYFADLDRRNQEAVEFKKGLQ